MSSGQRQRVALGRAMVRNPAVFLLDKPLSNLDAKLRASMRVEITELHKRLETTFIYITHRQTEAITMADHIVIMKDGMIQQIDTPQNLYRYPLNQFVAGFISMPQMNFIPPTLHRNSGTYFMDIVSTENYLHLEYFGQQLVCRTAEMEFPSDAVSIIFDTAQILLFHKETGTTIRTAV